MYASLFEVSGALHLDVFEQPEQEVSFSNLLEHRTQNTGDGSQETETTSKKLEVSHKQ